MTEKKKFAVDVIESERGWGQRVDETRYFDTYEEAEQFRSGVNSHNNEQNVPDWYMYATEPYKTQGV